MKYQGKLVILDKPVYESKISGLELSPEAQASMEADLVKHYTRLKVHAIGAIVLIDNVVDYYKNRKD